MAKKKKWKKRIKKALKGAALAGGAMLALKALKGRGTSSPFLASGAAGGARLPKGDSFARARKLMTSDPAYGNEGYTDAIRRIQPQVPSRNMYSANDFGLGPYDGAKKGGRAGKDFGKRGVGKAKRGFGRALKGGK